MWVDAFLIVSSIYVTAYPKCANALLKYMHTVRSRIKVKKKLVWRENDVQFILKKGRNSLISIALVDYGLYIDQSPQSPSCVSEPRQLNCSDFKYKGVFQRHNCFYKN